MENAQAAKKQRTPTNVSPEEVSETEATLAKNIKMYREAFGMTQEEVARAIGTSISSVQHWEQGLKVPRPEWLTSLAKLYRIEVANLFGLKAQKVGKRKRR
jgi:DNA-binding transcriptional regulator YiaG